MNRSFPFGPPRPPIRFFFGICSATDSVRVRTGFALRVDRSGEGFSVRRRRSLK